MFVWILGDGWWCRLGIWAHSSFAHIAWIRREQKTFAFSWWHIGIFPLPNQLNWIPIVSKTEWTTSNKWAHARAIEAATVTTVNTIKDNGNKRVLLYSPAKRKTERKKKKNVIYWKLFCSMRISMDSSMAQTPNTAYGVDSPASYYLYHNIQYRKITLCYKTKQKKKKTKHEKRKTR